MVVMREKRDGFDFSATMYPFSEMNAINVFTGQREIQGAAAPA